MTHTEASDAGGKEHKPSLESKIAEELRKTGFPMELVAATIMQSWGYGVLHNPAYRDNDDGISREFDVRAYKSWTAVDVHPMWGIAVLLVVECKKSEKPWVFLTSPEANSVLDWIADPIPIHTNTHGFSNLGDHPVELVTLDRGHLIGAHHYLKLPRRARTYYEPFKGRDANSLSQLIFTAVMSCTKAVIFMESEKKPTRHPEFFYPVIVFSGDMFEAEIGTDKSIKVTRTQYVQLSHRYLYRQPMHSIFEDQEFIIDVVHEDYLPAYLDMIEQEMTALAASLRSAVLARRAGKAAEA